MFLSSLLKIFETLKETHEEQNSKKKRILVYFGSTLYESVRCTFKATAGTPLI